MTTFKKADKEDIELIRQLAEKSWNAAYANILSREQIDYMLSEMYSENEISDQMHHPHYHYYIISQDSVPIGFLGFEHHYEKDTTKLHRIYLLPEAKGKGAGKAALDFLKEKVSETLDTRIILNVNKHNDAKKVYESQQFKVIKEVVVDIGNGFVMDDYVMEFQL